jgi:hypothetical protein
VVKYTNHLLQIFTPNSELHIYYKNLLCAASPSIAAPAPEAPAAEGRHLDF